MVRYEKGRPRIRAKGGRVEGESGFTVVEVVVALTLLLVASLAFMPLYVYVSRESQTNRARLAATSLAAGVIEQIRALPYDKIGTVGGNPPGIIESTREVRISGVEAVIRTSIWWVDDPSDNDESGNDTVPYDYKRVRVTVTAPGLFTGRVEQVADIRTLASLEGEEEVYEGGNIRVIAVRGYNPDPATESPRCEGVRVDLVEGPDAPQTLWTGGDGQALFAILSAGQYTVRADGSSLGMMVRPGQEEQDVTISDGAMNVVVFEVEIPCRLETLTLKGGSAPITEGEIILVTPFVDENGQPITMGGQFHEDDITEGEGQLAKDWINEKIGNLWPVGVYDLKVNVPGYQAYDLDTGDEDPDTWNGQFAGPGQSENVTVRLTPM